MDQDPVFFKTPLEFGDWLREYHDKREVQWIGYYKIATGKPSMRWEESVREALCYGWIDGLRKSINDESYKIRFTPRRKGSHWSNKNIRMIKELIAEGRIKEPGLKTFEQLNKSSSRKASYEHKEIGLSKEYEKKFRANKRAWVYFTKRLAPGYTRQSIHWVMSAKQECTRMQRLKILIDSCEKGKKIPLLRRT